MPPAFLGRAADRLSPRSRARLDAAYQSVAVPWRARALVPFVPAALRTLVAPRFRLFAKPFSGHVLRPIVAAVGVRLVRDPLARADCAMQHRVDGVRPAGVPVLNEFCESIRKTHVAAVFEHVFGYALAVDPLTYAGPIVEKSDKNFTHDGRILDGPLTPGDLRPDRVYQRLVDTVEVGERGPEAVDLRPPIYAGRVPLVYVKRRPAGDRFSNTNTTVEVRAPGDVFTDAELALLGRFADAMGLDYGEVDVLRDRADGRIYVVDVTHGPGGPPNGLPRAEARRAVQTLGRAFAAAFADGTFVDRRTPSPHPVSSRVEQP